MTNLIGGRYEIIEELGRGSCGITFLAYDRHLPNQLIVVVKKLIVQSNSDPKTLQKFQDYFRQEAEILQKIGDKDGIPALHAFFYENNDLYLVQEYIKGSDLSARLIAGKSLEETETIEILRGILTPLRIPHNHDPKIIHRDLKPANIRVRQSDGKIFLIDFGVAKIQSSINPLTWRCGTDGYMPIEQISGNPSLSSDIYAVGIIGIQALAGLDPLNKGFPIANGNIIPNSLKASPKLIDWLNKAIAPNSIDRFVDASMALQALEFSKPPKPTTVNPPQKSKRYIPIILGLTACAFAAISVAIISRKQPLQPPLPPPVNAEKWQTYQNAGIKFEYPSQWEVVPIGSINDFQGSFTGDILEIHPVVNKNKSCSERLLLNIKNTPKSNYTIDLYRQDTIDKIKDLNEGVKLSDLTTPDTKFSGKPAYRLNFQRKDSQCKMFQILETGTINRGKSYYLNYSFVPSDRQENHRQIFDRVAGSFKLKATNP